MAQVMVKLESDSAIALRRELRERVQAHQAIIASFVQQDNIDAAKRFADELKLLEAALEAVREGIRESAG